MAKINLRPWREELRAEMQRQFVVMIAGAAVVAVGLVFLWQAHVNNAISDQESRNNYIDNAMTELEEEIAEIEDLRERREELLSRMQVIQDLQGLRPVIVRAFDEMVQTLPDGLYYTRLEKRGERISLVGMAESNSRISSLMRNFERSDWFDDPNLTNVSSADRRRAGYSEFNMTVQQQIPESEQEQ